MFRAVVLMGSVLVVAVNGGELRVGAARVDIAPAENVHVRLSGFGGRVVPFEGIHDRIYYRVLVVEDGSRTAVIIVGDVLDISHDFWDRMSKRIEREVGIPRRNIIHAGTHTHGAPIEDYTESETIADKIMEAVKQAKSELQPARFGVGKGHCSVNINRRARTARGNALGGWWLGQNPDGPSDKTMHVIKFESLDGKVIAMLCNYSAHGTTMGQDNLKLTADHPGATSRFVEKHYDDTAVVVWTSGAAGDQDPIYAYKKDFGGRISPVEVLGRVQGEEILRIAESMKMTSQGRIRAVQSVVSAPGRKNVSGRSRFRPEGDYEFIATDPVDIRLSVIMINQIALCGVSGEVLTKIGQRLKTESPFAETMMITHANGSSGYIPDDEAYGQLSYEILVTPFQPGVEKIVIDRLLELLNRM